MPFSHFFQVKHFLKRSLSKKEAMSEMDKLIIEAQMKLGIKEGGPRIDFLAPKEKEKRR
jgi:hypothetical protein